MRARGSCSTQRNAATRLHMHRRLQAGVDDALQSLRSHAKIGKQGTVVTSRTRSHVLGRDVLPPAWAVVTGLECTRDAERCWSGATCLLRRCHTCHG